MNNKDLDTLEYNKIKQRLYQFATTEMGQQIINKLVPSDDLKTVQSTLNETQDGADILRLKGGIPIPHLNSISAYLKRLDMKADLNGKELAAIGAVLRTTNEVKKFLRDLQNDEVKLLTLYESVHNLQTIPEISRKLLLSIENDGHVTNDASTLLKSLRQQINATEETIRSKLADFTRQKKSKYLSDSVVTIRNDRYVIPVKSEYRGQFGGIVHDQSSSGATLFIEPREIVDLNNRLKKQQADEKEEIRRILAELSAEIAPFTAEIAQNSYILGELDFINAKAKFAASLKATQPQVSAENDIYLRQVWHPLLNLKKAVKNDIALGKDYQAIIITGPNTGGKTITLKTLGIIQLMGQSGLFISAAENSRIGVFSNIFADIGDEQSIEQSLSTFSAHMTNIVEILHSIDERSLALFDELGAGTDPQEGSALAIAILDALGAKGSYVIATTHYPELKVYGYERPGTINASMEFDSQTLRPTYRLLIGIPGRSNALDISLRLGLDKTIVTAARQLTAADSQNLNAMITDLVNKRHDAEERAINLQSELEKAEKLHADLEKNYTQFVSEREKLIEAAKAKANEIVTKTKEESASIIANLRKMRLDGGNSIKENELIDAQSQLNQLEKPIKLQKNKVLKRAKSKKEFKPNDDVLVTSYGQRGVLLQKLASHTWEVQLGILKMKIAESDLEKIKIEEKHAPRANTVLRSSSKQHVSPKLDLRGQRYEEAMNNVDHYIDASILAGYPSVTIVHGKGTGALRNGITQYLQQNSAVKNFEFAAPNAGGNGATIVYFN